MKKDPTPKATEAAAPATVEEILGAFTIERVHALADLGLRETLAHAHAMAKGFAATLLAGGHQAEQLAEIHVTLEDVRGLVADSLHLLDEIADRDRKQAAATAATAAVQATDREIHGHLSSYTLMLRGKLGPKSPALKAYGVQPMATGGRKSRAAQNAAPVAGDKERAPT